ncbi:unnamed protein product [Arabidopsis thaliana]|uniref:(thale cress) hypothetical protein n=1 Tax=Arabidopsis thaliana TaxID=3702 RepID=A0A7G2E6G5_ARATH|nr:unnamed protein product [Arabidopsis thaliana]
MPPTARTRKMMDQETYLMERITKAKEQLTNLAAENRELQVRRFMFDCVEGKMSQYRYDAKDLQDFLAGDMTPFLDADATAGVKAFLSWTETATTTINYHR